MTEYNQTQHRWDKYAHYLPPVSAWIAIFAIISHFILYLLAMHSYAPESIIRIPLQIAMILAGIPLLLQIIIKICQLNLGADLLAGLALGVAAYLGQDLAAVFIVLMLASGQWLEAYASKKASFALLELSKRMPATAHRLKGELREDVNLSDIVVGDLIEVHPHETCPVDGIVTQGHGRMDESYLTGEPYHISKSVGSHVLSGAINGESLLIIQAEKPAADSRYSKIIAVMAQAEQQKPKLRRLADQLGLWFIPIALIIAISTFYLTGSSLNFLAVLVIATPCPLLLAIPIVIISSISIAAKHSIVIKDPSVLERLPTCRTAIFDKTGTLTYGQPKLIQIATLEHIPPEKILQLVASLEHYSRHPLAHAILAEAKQQKLRLLEVQQIIEQPGEGLQGSVAGHLLQITSRRKLAQTYAEELAQLPTFSVGLECLVLMDGHVVAAMLFHDSPRQDSDLFIHHLKPKHQFNKIMLISGDRDNEVKYLAKLVGIEETYSSQTPEQKLALVTEATKQAPTLYVGDGINDAPSLAAATVGISFGVHNSVTSEAAGAVILESSLKKVDELFHISLNMRRIALQSGLGGMGLSLIGMILAAFGYIPPVWGAIIQQVIDFLAILNALRVIWHVEVETDLH